MATKAKEETSVAEAQVESAITDTKQQITEAEKQGEPQETVEQYKERLVGLQSQLEEWQKTAKAHQKAQQEKEAELRRYRESGDKAENVERKLEVLATMVADLMDKEGEDFEEKPKQRRSEQYLAKLKETDTNKQNAAQQAVQAEQARVAAEIATLTKSANLDVDSPDLLKAQNMWLRGDIHGALEEVKRVADTKKTEAKDDGMPKTITDLEKWYSERRKKEKIESGNLDAETGLPASGAATFTREQIRNMSIEEYKEKKTEIEAARQAGRIK